MRAIILSALLVFAVIPLTSTQALADSHWQVQKDPLGPGYLVSNGDKTIRAKTEKEAKKKAKALNKDAAEFKDDGTGPCGDSDPTIHC